MNTEEPNLTGLNLANSKMRFLARLPVRTRVFLLSMGFLIFVSLGICLLVVAKTGVFNMEILHFFVSVLAGPFAALGSPLHGSSTIAIGIATLLSGLAHPVYPNLGTAIVTGIGFGFWFLCGLMISCISV